MTNSTKSYLTPKKYPILEQDDKIIIDHIVYKIIYICNHHYTLKELPK